MDKNTLSLIYKWLIKSGMKNTKTPKENKQRMQKDNSQNKFK